jgi:NAD(P)-dependent dehydrogenase (short-subunit alcohol dehydrogenase family)
LELKPAQPLHRRRHQNRNVRTGIKDPMNVQQKPSLQSVVFPSLAGRVAIITGAGQGIGRTFAKAFATAGAVSVIAERNQARGQMVAEEIGADGGQAIAIETDVADPDAVEAMVKAVDRRYGRVDILVNNAGIFSTLEMRRFDQIPLAEWEQVLRVNVTGPFLCSRAVVPAMRRAKWGRIINMASGAVSLGRPNYLHYITSKGALDAMSRSMARELGGDGITVNAILPGATFTEIERKTVTPEQKERIIAMQCIPRAEAPEDLVGTVLFLASDASGFLTGQAITVDGGATHP